jgi:hypothetical protein
MFSRPTRIVAVLLGLAQLALWGFYAPAHRLTHHTRLAVRVAETSCHSHCCSHHHPSTTTKTVPTDHSHDQCPDDEDHCGLCLIALQSGIRSEAARFEILTSRVETFALFPVDSPECHAAAPFDSRGPPVA